MPGPATWTGLAIDLDGSLEQRVRPGELCAAYLDELRTSLRRLIEGRRRTLLFVLQICAF